MLAKAAAAVVEIRLLLRDVLVSLFLRVVCAVLCLRCLRACFAGVLCFVFVSCLLHKSLRRLRLLRLLRSLRSLRLEKTREVE